MHQLLMPVLCISIENDTYDLGQGDAAILEHSPYMCVCVALYLALGLYIYTLFYHGTMRSLVLSLRDALSSHE